MAIAVVGASPESIKSLCTDREGVMIGFVVTEVNAELEEKLQEKQKVMQELASTAKAISSTFGDPMLEFDLLIDQLDTKPSAIQVRFDECNALRPRISPMNCDCVWQICSKFIVRHQHLHERIGQKLVETMESLHESTKGRSNIVFVIHDVIKSVRAAFPPKDRNEKMRESRLVQSLERILYPITKMLSEEAMHSVRWCRNMSLVGRSVGFAG